MPLPLIISAAVLAGGYGVKKGIDAKSDFDAARRINEEAKELYDNAKEALEHQRESTQNHLESLGVKKIEIYRESIIPFVECFRKIKNIDFKELEVDCEKISPPDMQKLTLLCNTSLELKEIVSGGIAALGAGGIAGFAAYGSVGILATASTGISIGVLSGAAATNATLAWLGGGTLATGGFGMAGGTAVLGGIVAGPVLAVGGMMLASKAEVAKNDAYSNLHQAELAAEQMETARVTTAEIGRRLHEMQDVITQLDEIFFPLLKALQRLVKRNTNYEEYSERDKQGVYITVSTAQMLKMLLDVPLLNTNGMPTEESQKVLAESPKQIVALEKKALSVNHELQLLFVKKKCELGMELTGKGLSYAKKIAMPIIEKAKGKINKT